MEDATSITPGTKLTKKDTWTAADKEKPRYCELVGSLLYAARVTRPDIAHAVSILGQVNENFEKSH